MSTKKGQLAVDLLFERILWSLSDRSFNALFELERARAWEPVQVAVFDASGHVEDIGYPLDRRDKRLPGAVAECQKLVDKSGFEVRVMDVEGGAE